MFKKIFLVIYLPLFCAISLGFLLYLFVDSTRSKKSLAELSTAHVALTKLSIESIIDDIHYDLRHLEENPLLIAAVNEPSPDNYKALAKRFFSFIQDRPFYDQVRLLSDRGKELVRVNHGVNSPQVVASEYLQDKSNRYYFIDAIALNAGAVFMSPFDLNLEKGQVERPFRPMIRVGTPVADANGRKKGVLLLNFRGDVLIDLYKGSKINMKINHWMLNKDGYWFVHEDPSWEWGFMFGNNKKLQTANPEVAKKIFGSQNGQFEYRDTVYSFDTVYPYGIMLGHEKEKIPKQIWKIVETIPYRSYSMFRPRNDLAIPILSYIGVLLLSAIMTWRIADYREKYLLSVQQLKLAATHDAVTGLPNRTLLEDRAELAMAHADRNKTDIGIMYMDLDGFKPINDKHGHPVGDMVLVEIAKRLKKCIRMSDTVARVGGDEFVIMIAPINHPGDVRPVAEKIIRAIERPIIADEITLRVSASLGIAVYPRTSKIFDHVVRSADAAMYRAKKDPDNAIHESETSFSSP